MRGGGKFQLTHASLCSQEWPISPFFPCRFSLRKSATGGRLVFHWHPVSSFLPSQDRRSPPELGSSARTTGSPPLPHADQVRSRRDPQLTETGLLDTVAVPTALSADETHIWRSLLRLSELVEKPLVTPAGPDGGPLAGHRVKAPAESRHRRGIDDPGPARAADQGLHRRGYSVLTAAPPTTTGAVTKVSDGVLPASTRRFP